MRIGIPHLGNFYIPLKSLMQRLDIDYVVPVDEPLLTSHWEPPDEVASRIGRNIANLIDDGSTLQMGIGAIPDSVLHHLSDKKDLGIHTEMFSDGFMDLFEKGVLNNSKKTLHPGKTIASFCLGSEKLYEFVDNNPSIEFHPTEYTNDLKRRQMRLYGRRGSLGEFQEDHLISLELGGHPTDSRNLWPQPYPRASAVDAIENELNRKVCSGELSLADAQRRESALKHTDG